MVQLVCEKNKCCGCNACKNICPKDTIIIKDEMQYFEAEINLSLCIECGMCKKVCPNNIKPKFLEPKKWYQGWARNNQIRDTSSSGGFARTVSEQFIKDGGYVCSCVFQNGDFVFKIVDSIEELEQFQGSKYVKSNPQGCYRDILQRLKAGDKVMLIALPCQVAAAKNFVGEKYVENLVTIDLICHGTPSIKVLDMFFKEKDCSLEEIEQISFRQKNMFSIDGEKRFTPFGVMDNYTIAFLTGSCYTENCYQCQYARKERISDITIGDSWGSELINEETKGISLILCQTKKGLSLLENLEFELKPVDLERAIEANHQLNSPSSRPIFLDDFYRDLKAGRNFSYVVFKYCKIKCIKQYMKRILIKMHFLKIRGDTE